MNRLPTSNQPLYYEFSSSATNFIVSLSIASEEEGCREMEYCFYTAMSALLMSLPLFMINTNI